MSDYFVINHYDRGGELAISRTVFARIAEDAVRSSEFSGSVKLSEPIKVVFKKDGRVTLKVSLILKKGSNATEVSSAIQHEISRYLEVYAESVPFEINISVDGVK